MENEALPLAGIRVLDLTEVWAGPMAATYLADWGAEVIRVESYPRYETLRPVVSPPGGLGFSDNDATTQPVWERQSRRFIANHSKKGIALNMRDPRGYEVALRLAAVSDVVIENSSSGTVDRLGFGWDVLHKLNPRLIMASLSGWGADGPYSGYGAMGANIEATTGHHVVRGYTDEDLTQSNLGYHPDAMAPLAAVTAISAALHERNSTGAGRHLDLSMAEVLLTTLARQVSDASLNGERGQKFGNSHPHQAPHGCYPCLGEDRWITIAVETDLDWQALCGVLDRPDLATRPELATMAGRLAQRAELDRELSASTAGWDANALMEALQTVGVAAGTVYDDWEVMADPQLRARDFWLELDQDYVGKRTYPRVAWRMVGMEPAPYRTANTLGEHNVQVLRDILGMAPAEIEALSRDKVIVTSYL